MLDVSTMLCHYMDCLGPDPGVLGKLLQMLEQLRTRAERLDVPTRVHGAIDGEWSRLETMEVAR